MPYMVLEWISCLEKRPAYGLVSFSVGFSNLRRTEPSSVRKPPWCHPQKCTDNRPCKCCRPASSHPAHRLPPQPHVRNDANPNVDATLASCRAPEWNPSPRTNPHVAGRRHNPLCSVPPTHSSAQPLVRVLSPRTISGTAPAQLSEIISTSRTRTCLKIVSHIVFVARPKVL